MKVVKKITPIISRTLCTKKCKYSWDNHCHNFNVNCRTCKMNGENDCICTTLKNGQPCPYFERYKEEAQQ